MSHHSNRIDWDQTADTYRQHAVHRQSSGTQQQQQQQGGTHAAAAAAAAHTQVPQASSMSVSPFSRGQVAAMINNVNNNSSSSSFSSSSSSTSTPFHRGTNSGGGQMNKEQAGMVASMPSLSSSSLSSSILLSSSSTKLPPPVPNQFKRSASPSVGASPPPVNTPTPIVVPVSTSATQPHPQSSSSTHTSTSILPISPFARQWNNTSATSVPQDNKLAYVMSELRQVYTPVPAFSATNKTFSAANAASATTSTNASPAIRVVSTVKGNDTTRNRYKEEKKEQTTTNNTSTQPPPTSVTTPRRLTTQQQTPNTSSNTSSTVKPVLLSPTVTVSPTSEEKEGEPSPSDEDDGSDDDENDDTGTGNADGAQEDEDDNWMEFTNKKTGATLFYNWVTREIQLNRETVDTQGIDKDREEEDTQTERDIHRHIQTERGQRGETLTTTTALAGETAERDGPTLSPSLSPAAVDDFAELDSLSSLPPVRVLSCLSVMDRALDSMINKGVNLTNPVINTLNQMKSLMSSALHDLNEIVSHDEKNEVEALIEYKKLPWNFRASAAASTAIDSYRAAAAETHTDWEKEQNSWDWAFPKYISTLPLPPHSAGYPISIRLPEEDPHNGSPAVPMIMNMTIDEHNSAQALIRHVLFKAFHRQTPSAHSSVLPSFSPPSTEHDYVLKVIGSEDYMYGEEPLMSYDHVRHQIRNQEDISVVMIKRSTHPPSAPSVASSKTAASLTIDYLDKLNPDVKPLHKGDYALISSRDDWKQMTVFSVYDVHFPLRYRIHGIDHFNAVSLPRLSSTHCSHFFLKSFLFHGTSKVMNTESVTLPFHMHSGPRFQQGWITHKDLIYSGLPRELRLGLILSGRRDDGKEVVLAYSSINLVDEQGLFLCGLQSIKLWSVKESQKHKKDKEDKLGEIDKYLFRLCPVQNESEREVAKVMIEIESFALPLVCMLYLFVCE